MGSFESTPAVTVTRGMNDPCVICGSTSHRQFLRQGQASIVACRECGLRYVDPMPSTSAVRALYSDDYFRSESPLARGYENYEADADNLRATFRDRLRLLPRPAKDARLLDVGAAAGFFVEQARLAGWDAEGLEPNESAAKYARERLEVRVRAGSLDDVHYPAESFAAVTLWEVIEHLPAPRELIREIARILQPGGLLALSTPDAGSAVARLSGRRWLGWKKIPEHVFFFDRATLERLLSEEGFDIVSRRHVALIVRLDYAMQRLGALLGLPLLGRIPRVLGRLPVRINPLYDLMIVARRRP